MANLIQQRLLEGLSGVVPVDKPAGIAFASVVKAVKRKFNLLKVGHGGALDAAASGLFIVLINEANRHVSDFMGADRHYEGTFRLGLRTNTGDMQGVRLHEATPDEVAQAIGRIDETRKGFLGDIFQTEPAHCAVRREASADYTIAETGEHAPLLTHVYRFETRPSAEGQLPFSIVATKNLIVRSLADDFGAALGCGAALDTCRRLAIGRFSVADAIPFNRLLETEPKDFPSCVIPVKKALP